MNRAKNILLHIGIIIVLVLELLAGYWLITASSSMRPLLFGGHILLVAIFTFLFKNIKSEKFQENSNFVKFPHLKQNQRQTGVEAFCTRYFIRQALLEIKRNGCRLLMAYFTFRTSSLPLNGLN